VLIKVGVTEVIFAIAHEPNKFIDCMKKYEKELNVKFTYSEEKSPLGTAGPLALAKDKLDDGEPFFVLNSDITCSFPFEDLLKFHKSHGHEGTIMVTKVDEPSKYGVVIMNPEDGKIQRFVEKPSTFVGNKINSGIYIFNPSILNRIQIKPTSIEKEIFPIMAEEGELHAMELSGFWMDVGQPKDYLLGMGLYLSHINLTEPEKLRKGTGFIDPVLVDPTATVGQDCLIGPNVTIGPNCVIEDGVRLRDSAILGSATIKMNTWIKNSIIGWHSTVGRWARIENFTVLGESVVIEDQLYINATSVLPNKTVTESVYNPNRGLVVIV